MENKRPFSLYDFLGYFAPGALFLYIALFFIKYFDDKLYRDIIEINFGRLELFVAFVIFAYVIGHSLNYLSSITIEKYSVWMYGFPSYFLLFGTKKRYFKKRSYTKDVIDLKIENFESTENFKTNFSIRNKGESKLRLFLSWFFSCLWRLILVIILFPIFLFDFIVGRIFKLKLFYTNQLDIVLSNAILNKINILFTKLNIQFLIGTDYFRVISHYYYENYEKHQLKYDNYVALYGFTRTLSFIFCITTWLFAYLVFFSNVISLDKSYCFWVLFLLGGISYVFFMAFMKFYRRYTLEGFMCLLVDKKNEL